MSRLEKRIGRTQKEYEDESEDEDRRIGRLRRGARGRGHG